MMSTPSSNVLQTLPTIDDLPYEKNWTVPLIMKKAPRPSNAFMLFLQWNSLLGNLKGEHASTVAGELWRQATQVVKGHFNDLAEQVKRKHLERYPGYVFRPKPKKKTTDRQKENGHPYPLTSRTQKYERVGPTEESMQSIAGCSSWVKSLDQCMEDTEPVPSARTNYSDPGTCQYNGIVPTAQDSGPHAGASMSFVPPQSIFPADTMFSSVRRTQPVPLGPMGQPFSSKINTSEEIGFDRALTPQSLPLSLIGALDPQASLEPSASAPLSVAAIPSNSDAGQLQTHSAAETQASSTEITENSTGSDNEAEVLFTHDDLEYLASESELMRSLPNASEPEEDQRDVNNLIDSDFNTDDWLVFEN